MTAHTTEPTEMELRVARAVQDAMLDTDDGDGSSDAMAVARAAIQAMREPTLAMEVAGIEPFLVKLDSYRAMITAASPPD